MRSDMAVEQERIEVRPTGPHTNKLQLMKNMVALPALLKEKIASKTQIADFIIQKCFEKFKF